MSGFTPESFHSVVPLTVQDQQDTLELLYATATQASQVTDGLESVEHARVAQTAQSQLSSIRGDSSWLPANVQRLVSRNLGIGAHVEENIMDARSAIEVARTAIASHEQPQHSLAMFVSTEAPAVPVDDPFTMAFGPIQNPENAPAVRTPLVETYFIGDPAAEPSARVLPPSPGNDDIYMLELRRRQNEIKRRRLEIEQEQLELENEDIDIQLAIGSVSGSPAPSVLRTPPPLLHRSTPVSKFGKIEPPPVPTFPSLLDMPIRGADNNFRGAWDALSRLHPPPPRHGPGLGSLIGDSIPIPHDLLRPDSFDPIKMDSKLHIPQPPGLEHLQSPSHSLMDVDFHSVTSEPAMLIDLESGYRSKDVKIGTATDHPGSSTQKYKPIDVLSVVNPPAQPSAPTVVREAERCVFLALPDGEHAAQFQQWYQHTVGEIRSASGRPDEVFAFSCGPANILGVSDEQLANPGFTKSGHPLVGLDAKIEQGFRRIVSGELGRKISTRTSKLEKQGLPLRGMQIFRMICLEFKDSAQRETTNIVRTLMSMHPSSFKDLDHYITSFENLLVCAPEGEPSDGTLQTILEDALRPLPEFKEELSVYNRFMNDPDQVHKYTYQYLLALAKRLVSEEHKVVIANATRNAYLGNKKALVVMPVIPKRGSPPDRDRDRPPRAKSPFPDDKRYCVDFQTGACAKAGDCKYLHEPEPASHKAARATSSANRASRTPPPKGKGRACFHWKRGSSYSRYGRSSGKSVTQNHLRHASRNVGLNSGHEAYFRLQGTTKA